MPHLGNPFTHPKHADASTANKAGITGLQQLSLISPPKMSHCYEKLKNRKSSGP